MSIDIIPRYVIRSVPPIPPAQSYYIFDQAESPARTAAVCTNRADAERVRAGLELLHVLEGQCGEPVDVAGVPV